MDSIRNEFVFLELLQQGEAKDFDGMAAGTFVDMFGRKVTIKPNDLAEFVKNTDLLLKSTITDSGELVGLPVDVMDHAEGDGAGWIKGVSLAADRDVVKFTAEWNDLGQDLITRNIRRFFSPTIDLNKKQILGGTLTNWPASRNFQTGEILLKPIELSAGIYTSQRERRNLIDGSMNDQINEVVDAFFDYYGFSFDLYPVDIFSDRIVVYEAGKYFELKYSKTSDGYEFESRENWIEVRMTYVKVDESESGSGNLMNRLLSQVVGKLVPNNTTNEKGKELIMTKNIEQVENAESQAINLQDPEVVSQLTANPEFSTLVSAEAEKLAAAKLTEERRKNDVAKFTLNITGGTDDKPEGLPVDQATMSEFLLSLDDDQLVKAKAIFEQIAEKGILRFQEKGDGQVRNGNKELPAFAKSLLSNWRKAGKTIAEFFQVNAAELGAMEDYDLKEFETDPAK